MTGPTARTSGPQWRDVIDLIERSEVRILAAIKEVKDELVKHDERIEVLEDTAERRKGVQTATTFFLTAPGKLLATVASGAALVLSLIGVWAAMGRLG